MSTVLFVICGLGLLVVLIAAVIYVAACHLITQANKELENMIGYPDDR